MKRGDFVTVYGPRNEARAMVVLASENGESLMLMFNDFLWVSDGGYAGACAVLKDEQGTYRDLMTNTILRIVPDNEARDERVRSI